MRKVCAKKSLPKKWQSLAKYFDRTHLIPERCSVTGVDDPEDCVEAVTAGAEAVWKNNIARIDIFMW